MAGDGSGAALYIDVIVCQYFQLTRPSLLVKSFKSCFSVGTVNRVEKICGRRITNAIDYLIV